MGWKKWVPWLGISVCLILAGYSWASGGLLRELFSGDGQTQITRVREYILSFGSFAPVVYTLVVVVEVVVAPLPGLVLYAPGGIIFGTWLGGGLSLLGNLIGAGIACGVTRSIGDSWLSRFFPAEQLETMQQKIQAKGPWLIFLLRLNPLTSSDVISYAAGFTRIPLSKFLVATGCGMAPLCFLQAWLAGSLLQHYPDLFYPLVAVMVIYTVGVVVALYRMLARAKHKAASRSVASAADESTSG